MTVKALDANGNVATDYAGTVVLHSSDPGATVGATSIATFSYSFTPSDAGVHTFGVTLPSTGFQTLMVQDASNPSIAGVAGDSTQFSEFSVPTANALPAGIALGPDGNLWFSEVSDTANQIGRITPAGVVTEFSIPSGASEPLGIVAGPDGNVWFTEMSPYHGNGIGRINPTTGDISEFGTGDVATFGATHRATAITTGPDGNLWFTTIFDGNGEIPGVIGRMTPAGDITSWIAPGMESDQFPRNDSVSIAVGSDGNLWFTLPYQNQIGRITPDGTITEFDCPTMESNPLIITAGPDGNLWFTEVDTTSPYHLADRIGRITPTGVITEFAIPSGDGNGSITAGPDGNLWFTDDQHNQIGRITPTGVLTWYSLPAGSGGSYIGATGIVAGPNGTLWFTEPAANKIGRLQLGVNVHVTATPTFSLLTSSTIIVGTSTVNLSGHLGDGSNIPSGNVIVGIGSTTLTAPIQTDGSFAVNFPTAWLSTGTYSISYSYGGDQNFLEFPWYSEHSLSPTPLATASLISLPKAAVPSRSV